MFRLWTDGGTTAVAYIIERDDQDPIIGIIPLGQKATGNQAEYIALIAGLREVHELYSMDHLTIITDSRLMHDQLLGDAQCNNIRLSALKAAAEYWLDKFRWDITWVPREENKAGIMLERWQKTGVIG